jgi:predicted molibdopterin-dependent oxidoreductase YjgC
MIEQRLPDPVALVDLVIDGAEVVVPDGSTLLDACRLASADVPTLCFLETASPINSCRVCVVEIEGSRTLVPSCSRPVTDGMVVHTESPRVVDARRTVYELLASAVDLSLAEPETVRHMERYDVDPDRFAGGYRRSETVRIEDDLYVRDYDKCIMCYRCVVACGVEAQNTFAIDIAGRGLRSTISTEYDITLPESACVYCGNCVGVCPTGALMVKSEYDLRRAGDWDESRQTTTRTVCSFCGVGCNLDLHVQDNRIVKVISPIDHDVTNGYLCIKGRFGYTHIQEDAEAP